MYCPTCARRIDDVLEAHARLACPVCDGPLLEPSARLGPVWARAGPA
jgi:hypothetical protein